MDKELFISKSNDVHGSIYDYSLIRDIKNTKTKVPIMCSNHGVFYKDYEHHVGRCQGCPECSGKKRYNTEDFINKANVIHNNKYAYEKTVYKNTKTKVIVTCPEHGDFEITPLHHLNGQGCPKCRYIKSAQSKRRNLDQIIYESKLVHGDKYSYDEITEYKNDRIKYPIVCKEHGVFYQNFNAHIKAKQGCPICGRRKSDINRRLTTEEFIEKARKIHGDEYEYNGEYVTNNTKIGITCKKHGVFYMTPSNHLIGQKCPKCYYSHSRGEDEIYEFLSAYLDKSEITQRVRGLCGGEYEFDIYLPKHKIAIEYNGLYWHSEIHKDNNYHLDKTNKCIENGIKLIHIFEDEWVYKKEIVKSMLLNLINKTELKIFARKCEIKEVNPKDGNEFLNNNHLQGVAHSKIKIGLYYNGELVSMMAFGKSRHFIGAKTDGWELYRFCNKLNSNVIGGASKILKYFVEKYKPTEIVSYADKRWSNGNLYEKLGFEKYNESKPNYYYIINGKRVYRFNLRKSILIEKYDCPHDMTEKEFCWSKKWYRIYDCGCLCYRINFLEDGKTKNN